MGLIAHGVAGSGGFFHQRGVLLRHLIHLQNGFVDLLNPAGLLAGGGGDFGHNVTHFFDRGDDLFEGLPGASHQPAAVFNLAHAVGNQPFDLFSLSLIHI